MGITVGIVNERSRSDHVIIYLMAIVARVKVINKSTQDAMCYENDDNVKDVILTVNYKNFEPTRIMHQTSDDVINNFEDDVRYISFRK